MSAKIRIPNPSQNLTKEERRLYREICQTLIDADGWQPIFRIEITEAAQCYFRLQAAKEAAEKKGWVEEYEQGSNVTGYNTDYYKARSSWEKHCQNLGLTPYARDKIKSLKATEKKQPGIMARIEAIRTAPKKQSAA